MNKDELYFRKYSRGDKAPPSLLYDISKMIKIYFRFSNDIYKSGSGGREISISFKKNKGCLGSTNLNPNI